MTIEGTDLGDSNRAAHAVFAACWPCNGHALDRVLSCKTKATTKWGIFKDVHEFCSRHVLDI